MTGTRVGLLAGSTAAVLFGSSFVATAYQLRSFDPVAGAFWRAAVAGLLLVGWAGLTWRPRARTTGVAPPWSRWWRAAVLGILGGPAFLVGVNVAVDGVGASVTAFVAGSYAIGAAMLAPIVLRERLTVVVLAAFVVALLGTALLAQLDVQASTTRGLVAAGLAALAYSFYLVLGRRWSVPFDLTPRALSFATIAASLVALPGWHAVASTAPLWPEATRGDALVALVWLGVTLTVGQMLIMVAARQLDARRVGALLLLNPLSAFALAVLVLGERLSTAQLVGAALIVLGIAVGSTVDNRSKSPLALKQRS